MSKVFKSQSVTPADPEELRNILKLANEFTNKNNSKLYFIYLPRYERYIQKSNNDDLFNYKKIIKIVNHLLALGRNEQGFTSKNKSIKLDPWM